MPLSVVYTGLTRAGAVGAGWDIPLTYVAKERPQRTRPRADATTDERPDRLTLTLGGAPQRMVKVDPLGIRYVPYLADSYMELTKLGDGWTLRTLDNLLYVFRPAATIEGTNDWNIPDLWLLREIRDTINGDKVVIHYDTSRLGTCGADLRIKSLEYGFGSNDLPLYEIQLVHDGWWQPRPQGPGNYGTATACDHRNGPGGAQTAYIIDRSTDDHIPSDRTTRLTEIRVVARDNLSPADRKTIRSYHFRYTPEPDTDKPRLSSVTVKGEGGIGELPLASYRYGAVSTPSMSSPDLEVRYAKPVDVARSSSLPAEFRDDLSASYEWSEDVHSPPSGGGTEVFWGRRDYTRSTHMIRDLTGDGIPDEVWKDGSKWYLAAGRLTADGMDLAGPVSSWTSPSELFEQTTFRFVGDALKHRWGREPAITTETWRELVDWNGDGRLDVVDAKDGWDDAWKVWINEEGPNGGIAWRSTRIDISAVRRYLRDQGFKSATDVAAQVPMSGEWLTQTPVARSKSWTRGRSSKCREWRCPWGVDPDVHPPEVCYDGPAQRCALWADYEGPAGSDTVAEWSVIDANGDGYPDVASLVSPMHVCERPSELLLRQPPDATQVPGYYYAAQVDGNSEDLVQGSCEAEASELGSVVFLNRLGAFTSNDSTPFADTPVPSSFYEHWIQGTSLKDPPVYPPVLDAVPEQYSWHQTRSADPFAKGSLESIESRLPTDPWAAPVFNTDRKLVCADGQGVFTDGQVSGEADLNGDGLLDAVENTGMRDPILSAFSWRSWRVRFNTGHGYGPARKIDGHPEAGFALSESFGWCGDTPHHVASLIDLDADGLPDVVRIAGQQLVMSSLLPADSGDRGGVGRLIAIDNGYGATTSIRYANAKRDLSLAPRHMVPFPEIVVSEIRTSIVDGSGPDLEPVFYRYGNASMIYDGVSTRWTFPGYRRQLVLAGTSRRDGIVDGVLTAYDFGEPAGPGTTFAEKAVAGRLQTITRKEGSFDSAHLDPYLSGPDLEVQFASTSFAYGVRQLPLTHEGYPLTTLWPFNCSDQWQGNIFALGSDQCAGAGISLRTSTRAWEGNNLITFNNTQAGSKLLATDSRGRPTETHDEGDLHRTDDDVCTTTTYAGLFPSVVTSVTLTDCGLGSLGTAPGTPHTLARSRYLYDGLPFGQLGQGRLSSRWIDVYDDTGLIGTFQAAAYTYDALGEVATITTPRILGGASTRTTAFTRDAFGASVTSTSETASDVGVTFTRTTRASTWPSRGVTATQPSGVKSVVELDSFGRATRTGIEVGGKWTLSRTKYNDDADGRSLVVETFPGSTLAGAEDVASDRRRSTTWVDALGRTRFTQTELGASYDQTTVVSGLVVYDSLGRVAFAAAPFESAEVPFAPESLAALPYGTTAVFDRRGRLVKTVEAEGWNAGATVTSVSGKVFVSEVSYGYQAGQASVSTRGADEHDPSSPRFGQPDTVYLSAIGRETRRIRRDAQGHRKDLVDQTWDRLGRVTTTTRYADAAAMTGPAVWTARFDSLGRRLSMSEPGMSTQTSTFDEDGNALETAWYDGARRRTMRMTYDGYGRVTKRVLASEIPGLPVTIESEDSYGYDVHSGVGEQPAQPAERLLGRLSWISNPAVGDVYYAYDALGRGNAEVFKYEGHDVVRQTTESTIGGVLTSLSLITSQTSDTIDYGYDSAGRLRQVMSGATTLANATDVSALGQYGRVQYGNGVEESFSYDPQGRRELRHRTASTAAGNYVYENLTRDAAGRVTSERHTTPTTLSNYTATFDDLGRLASQVQSGGVMPGLEWFTYDGLGNLLTRTSTTGSGNRVYTPATEDPDRLCRFAAPGGGGCQFVYDGAGNVVIDTTAATRTFEYDAGQRITSVTRGASTVKMTYGPVGRMKTEVIGANARTVWNFGGLIEERTHPTSGVVQIERKVPGFGADISLRTRTAGGSTSTETIYAHGDGRANRFFTRSDGQTVQDVTYSSYGDITSLLGAADELVASDDLWNGGDNLPEVGLVVLGPRTYDPAMGRFLQRDPIAVVARSTTGNPYAFGFSDPVNNADPTGLTPEGSGQSSSNSGNVFSGAVGAASVLLAVNFLGFDSHGQAPQAAAGVGASQLKVGTTTLPNGMFSGRPVSRAQQYAGIGLSAVTDFKAGSDAAGDESARGMVLTAKRCMGPDNVRCAGQAVMGLAETVIAIQDDPAVLNLDCSRGCAFGLGGVARHVVEFVAISAATAGFGDVGVAAKGLTRGSAGAGSGGGLLDGGLGTAFAGHGVESALFGTTRIPPGTTLMIPGKAGVRLPDSLGRAIEAGDWDAILANPDWAPYIEGSASYLPGAEVPNLMLMPAPDLFLLRNSMRVSTETLLSDLLKPGMGHLDWAACRQGLM